MKRLSILGIAMIVVVALTYAAPVLAGDIRLGNSPARPALATTLTLNPTADAYVDSSHPAINYGAGTTLRVDGSPVTRAYLRFAVTGLSTLVTQATLLIYANSSLSTGVAVNRVGDNSWIESAIKYDNAPAPGSALGTSSAVQSGTWVSFDVSSYVTSNGTYSLAITSSNVTALSLASRESANKPQLVITTASGALPTATPTKAGPTPTKVLPTATLTKVGPTPTKVPPTATKTPGPAGDPIIFFNGDLVSSSSLARAQQVVALIKNLMAQHAGTTMRVASTGDNEQENTPTLSDYQNYFGTTYGTFFSQGIFKPVRGNHDMQDAGHGAAYAQYFGNPPLNYSYDLGAWHIIALDQTSSSVNSTALNFMKSDLAAHAGSKCQIAYWHVPTYSSGSAHGDATGLKSLNQAEYDAGVDIQLNGHDHDYQRFYPLAPDGKRDNSRGITTFVDGIGGQDGRVGSKTSVAQAASALYLDTFPGGGGDHAIGVIMFTLHASSADYALYDANNGAVLDQGTVNCH